MKKATCKKGKPCKGVCIPRSSECLEEGALIAGIGARLRFLEEQIRHEDTEYAYVVDPSTGRVQGPIGGESRSMVSIPSRMAKGAIVTHNHPLDPRLAGIPEYRNGFGFSRGDIVNSVAQGCAEVRAVTAGHTYSMKFPPGGSGGIRNALSASRAYEVARIEVESDLLARVRSRQTTIEQANANYHHEIAKRMAAQMNFAYSREPVDRRDGDVVPYDFERLDAVRRGRKCGKGYIPPGKKCRIGMAGSIGAARAFAGRAVESSVRMRNDAVRLLGVKKMSRLKKAGIGAGVVVGGLGIAAVMVGVHVKNQLDESSIDFNSIRQPPGGIPDEQTLKKYDTFKEGDIIRKVFNGRLGVRHHYGVYIGKDPSTGEHMVIDSGENWKTRSNTPFIQRRGLTWGASPNDTEWEVVPEKEIQERIQSGLGKRLPPEEVIYRAKSMLGEKIRYRGFESNCDSFAWAVATGDATGQQARGLSPLTKFLSSVVTDRALGIEVSSEAFPGGNIKPGIQIGPYRITGATAYGQDAEKVTTQQMAEYLNRQRALDVRRTMWQGIRNPYTGSVETPGAPVSTPGSVVPVAEIAKPPIRYEEMYTYMQDEMQSMLLADTDREIDRGKLKIDSPETELDEVLTALGIKTPKEFESKVSTLLGEVGGTSASVRRHHLYRSYLMLVLGMLNQIEGGVIAPDEGNLDSERVDAVKGKKCGRGYIPAKAKCKIGQARVAARARNIVELSAIAAAGAAVSAGGILALREIAKDVKASSTDPTPYKFTKTGEPDEETLASYDKLRPGDVIRNSFKRIGGYSNHYAIYAGKDKRTGEHMAYSVAVGGAEKSQVTLAALHSQPVKGASMYQKVPDEELQPTRGKRYSRLETVRRANELTGKTLAYNMLRDNCEHWARAVATGEPSSRQLQGRKPAPVTVVAADIISAVSSRIDPVTSSASKESTESMLNHLKKLEMKKQHEGGGGRFALAEEIVFQPSIYLPFSGNSLDIKSEIRPTINSPQVSVRANVSATGNVSPSASFTSTVNKGSGSGGGGSEEGGSGDKGKGFRLVENVNMNQKVSFPGGGNEANVSINFSPSILSPNVKVAPSAKANVSAFSPDVNVSASASDLVADLMKTLPNLLKGSSSRSDSEEDSLLDRVVDAIGLKRPDDFEDGLDAILRTSGVSGAFFKDSCVRNYYMMLILGIRFLIEDAKKGRKDAVSAQLGEGAIARTLARVLARSYTDGVDRILSIRAKGNVLYGHFLGDGKIIAYQLDLEKDQVSTQIAKDRRDTARLDGIREEVERLDAVRRKSSRRQCSIGLSCGGTCISRTKACKVSLNRLSSPVERASLKEGLRLFQDPVPLGTGPAPQEVGTPRYASPADNPNAGIRELKLAAQERGVYRYGAMNKSELRNAIRAVDENPQQNERIRRSIERKQEAKRVTEGSRFADYANDWIKAKKIMRIAGTGGPLAIAAAGAWVLGSTRREYRRVVDDYRSGFQDSAQQATAMAAKLPSERINKPNMMFVVGGYTAEDGKAAGIREAFDRLEAEEGEAGGWFNRENHIIEFDLNASDIPLPKGMKQKENGKYSDGYIGYLGRQAAMGTLFPKGLKGKIVKEVAGLKGGRNEDAVRLAAEIYAQARHSEPREEKLEDKTNAELRKELAKYGVGSSIRETKSELITRLYDIGAGEEEFVNGNLPINVVAYGGGGHTAREAMEIISRMEGGRDILDRVNLATISTPDFGFTKQIVSEVSLRSRHDPLTEILPTRAERTVNTVMSREMADYMADREVTNIIRQHFGYEQTSAFQRELERRRSRQRLLDLKDEEDRRKARAKEARQRAKTPATGGGTPQPPQPQQKPRKSARTTQGTSGQAQVGSGT